MKLCHAHLRLVVRSSFWTSGLSPGPESLEGRCLEKGNVGFMQRSARFCETAPIQYRWCDCAWSASVIQRTLTDHSKQSKMSVGGDTSLMKRRCDVCMKHTSRIWWLSPASSKASCFICSKIFAAYGIILMILISIFYKNKAASRRNAYQRSWSHAPS